MARIAGIDLPKEKRVGDWITYIYGIGISTARKILKETGVILISGLRIYLKMK